MIWPIRAARVAAVRFVTGWQSGLAIAGSPGPPAL